MSSGVSLIDGHIDTEPRLQIKPYDKCKIIKHCCNYGDFDCTECVKMCDKNKEMLQMAEFCLECLQKLEPNANEHNTTLSDNLEWCDGCGALKPIVLEFNDKEDKTNE